MIGFAIIIYIKCHIASHLTRTEVAFQEQALLDSLHPGGCPPFLEIVGIQGVECSQLLLSELYRVGACVGALRVQKLIRSFGFVAYSHTVAGSAVALAFQLQVEPHAEFLGYLIIYNLGALQHTTAGNIAAAVVAHVEGNATVLPVHQVFR